DPVDCETQVPLVAGGAPVYALARSRDAMARYFNDEAGRAQGRVELGRAIHECALGVCAKLVTDTGSFGAFNDDRDRVEGLSQDSGCLHQAADAMRVSPAKLDTRRPREWIVSGQLILDATAQ